MIGPMRFTVWLYGVWMCSADALKFLLYNPKSTRSHVLFMNKIADVLIDGGHEVVNYMPEVEKDFDSTFVHKRARNIQRAMDFEPLSTVHNFTFNEWEIDAQMFAMWRQISSIFEHFGVSCEHQLLDTALLEQLRSENFDLGLCELFDPCGFGIFEKIGLKKHIMLMSTSFGGMSSLLGIPATPSFTPDFYEPQAPPLSFHKRLISQLFLFGGHTLMFNNIMRRTNQAFRTANVNGTVSSLIGEMSYLFVNTDELVDFPRPISHKIINIAGVGLKKDFENPKPLEKSLQEVFDRSQLGVVYISFGSVAKSHKMPNATKKAFIDAIRQFPDITFLWKYEYPEDGTIEKLPNLRLEKWLPQVDILAQPKLLAFVSHGGMNSITEATYSGVPIVAIALFTDQPLNVLMVEQRKTAISVKKTNITKGSLVDAIRTIVYDKSYNENAKLLSKMIAAKPMGVDERVLRYSEFAARFDVHAHLDIYGRRLDALTFYNADVLAFVATAAYAFYNLVVAIARLLWRRCCRRKIKKSKAE